MKALVMTAQDAREFEKLGGLTITKPIKPAPPYIEGAKFDTYGPDGWLLIGPENRLRAEKEGQIYTPPVKAGDIVFLEGLIMGEAWGYVQEIYKRLKKAGYKVHHWLLKGENMGVPQTRHRVFFVGIRNDLGVDPVDLDMSFYYEPVRFREIKSGTGGEVGRESLSFRALQMAIPEDKDLAAVYKRIGERERCFTTRIVWEDIRRRERQPPGHDRPLWKQLPESIRGRIHRRPKRPGPFGGGAVNEALFSSSRDDWETPPDFFAELNEEFHFTLDACALPETAKCAAYFTPEDDGLSKAWNAPGGGAVFCNPPYSRRTKNSPGQEAWIKKAAEEGQRPGAVVVMLIPARTDTLAFHKYIYHKAEIRFIKGRLRFRVNGQTGDAAPFPSMDN